MQEIIKEIEQLTRRIDENPNDGDALYRRGTLLWKIGQRAGALSDLNAAAALNPAGPAAAAVANLNEIMSFFNPDLYNP